MPFITLTFEDFVVDDAFVVLDLATGPGMVDEKVVVREMDIDRRSINKVRSEKKGKISLAADDAKVLLTRDSGMWVRTGTY